VSVERLGEVSVRLTSFEAAIDVVIGVPAGCSYRRILDFSKKINPASNWTHGLNAMRNFRVNAYEIRRRNDLMSRRINSLEAKCPLKYVQYAPATSRERVLPGKRHRNRVGSEIQRPTGGYDVLR